MRRLALHVLVALLLAVPAVRAEVPRVLTWDLLVPPMPKIANPFTALTDDQVLDLEALVQIRTLEKNGLITKVDPFYEEAVEIAYQLDQQGLDVEALVVEYEALLAKVTALQKSVVKDLDGQQVRIPGYALPLELDESGTDEFLLVPYVGACIHVPPPPANQIVLVKLNQTYKAERLFEPVWITGQMKVEATNSSLFLVDGTADVEAAYVLEGIQVEPYEY